VQLRFAFHALPRTRHLLAALRYDCDGTAILEFAIVGPAFIALILAILNTMLIYFAQEGLETAAESAARLILTGAAQTTTLSNGHVGMTAADFKNAICNGISGTDSSGNSVRFNKMLPPMLNCSQLTVNVSTAPSYNIASLDPPTFTYNQNSVLTSTGTGYNALSQGSGQNQIVVLQLIYLWPTVKGPLGLDLSNQPNDNRMIVATSAFTAEAYSCAASQASC